MRRPKGFFLVFVLLMTVVVLMMVGVVLQRGRQSKVGTAYHSRQVAALEAAQAGSVDVIKRLEADKTWIPTTAYTVQLAGGRASYRIQFADPPVVDPHLSINNLSGEGPVDGPRGAETVPPHSAFLVLQGFSGEVRQDLHLIVKASPFSDPSAPLVTSGPQYFQGDVTVDGIRDFEDITPVESDIHSNSMQNVPLINWTSQPGETFRVNGSASAAADSNAVFNLNDGPGIVDVDSLEPRAGNRPFPQLNIEELVDNASGPPINSSTPGVVLVSGETKNTSNLEVQGDLVLQDATVFVHGNLKVNGSITGTGSIFVLGDTEFSGAAEVSVADGHVSLYSQGHVSLKGFNGTEFLDSLAPIDEPLERTKFALKLISDEITQFRYDPKGNDWQGRGRVDLARAVLGQDVQGYTGHDFLPGEDPHTGSDFDLFNPLQAAASSFGIPVLRSDDGNSVGECIAYLQSLQPAPDPDADRTINFLIQKLERLDMMTEPRVYIDPHGPPASVAAEVQAYLDNGTVTVGLVDNIIDNVNVAGTSGFYIDAGQRLEGELSNYNFDALGTSYFKGVVYSNGAVHCQNEVEILGGVYVENNRFSPNTTLDTGTRQLQPGDIQFDKNTKMTYVEGLLEQSPSPGGDNMLFTVYWSTPSSGN